VRWGLATLRSAHKADGPTRGATGASGTATAAALLLPVALPFRPEIATWPNIAFPLPITLLSLPIPLPVADQTLPLVRIQAILCLEFAVLASLQLPLPQLTGLKPGFPFPRGVAGIQIGALVGPKTGDFRVLD